MSARFAIPSKTHQEHVVLLIGGTGVGKSTLINCIINHFCQREPVSDNETQNVFYSPYRVAGVDNVTTSTTTDCYTYEFQDPKNHRTFKFIDTPGVCDTHGSKHIDRIIRAVNDAGHLSAIVVVAKGNDARVTGSVLSALACLAGNLPHDFADKNLLLVLTMTSKTGACFSLEDFAMHVARPYEVYYMNNTAFFTNPNWRKSQLVIRKLLDTVASFQATPTS